MLNVKSETTAENTITITFPAETLNNFGISGGDEIEITETENALILRPAQNERTKKILKATREIIERRRPALIELGKGHE